jgi:protein-tyrosine-phosphatase
MAELGYDLSKHESKSLDAFNGQQIDVAVTMGCGDACPAVRATRREEWNIPDPKHRGDDEFRAVRDLIRDKVQTLIDNIVSSST